MKHIRLFAILAGFISYFSLHFAVLSYENTVAHPGFNSTIVDFGLDILDKLDGLNFKLNLQPTATNKLEGPGVTNLGLFESTYGESALDLSPKDWIMHGGMSADEPEVPAAVRHFYDPLALSGHKYLTNKGTYWEGLYSNPGIDAIEWALGDTPKGEANKWSFNKGKEYVKAALEEKDLAKRRNLMAKAWRCLGETLHNTADMGCPSHVRNDSHAAPAGLSWGWAFGSPDPYEELFNISWIKTHYKKPVDEGFKDAIADATTARQINETLAKFTNRHFFTNETISGTGVKKYKSVNGEKDYPSPKLDDLSYVADEFAYYKTMPSGRKVKMCKDQSYFSFRGHPYIDAECAESQAAELIPYIANAGVHLTYLFIPEMSLYIESIDNDGKVKGFVTHAINDEYEKEIKYNGQVDVTIGTKVFITECLNGEFTGSVDADLITETSEVIARINCGGLTYFSEPFIKKETSGYQEFEMMTQVSMLTDDGDKITYRLRFDYEGSRDGEIIWKNKGFKVVQQSKGGKPIYIKTMDFQFMPDGIHLDRYKYTYDIDDTREEDGRKYVNTLKCSFDLINDEKQSIEFNLIGASYGFTNLKFDVIEKCIKNFKYEEIKESPVYDNKGKYLKTDREEIKSTKLIFDKDIMSSYFIFQ